MTTIYYYYSKTMEYYYYYCQWTSDLDAHHCHSAYCCWHCCYYCATNVQLFRYGRHSVSLGVCLVMQRPPYSVPPHRVQIVWSLVPAIPLSEVISVAPFWLPRDPYRDIPSLSRRRRRRVIIEGPILGDESSVANSAMQSTWSAPIPAARLPVSRYP